MRPLLRFAEDRRSLLFCGVGLTLLALQWTGAFRHPLLWIAAAWLVFVGNVVKHNHMHCPTFRLRPLNLVFQHLLGLWTGTSSCGILTAHNERHHGDNQGPSDFVRCSIVNTGSAWLDGLIFPPLAMLTMWREKPADLPRWWHRQRALFWIALVERVVLALVIGALLLVDAESTLLYVVGPWAFGQWALVGINWVQHHGCKIIEGPGCSHDVTGRFINWWLLNNGLHTAHHLSPGRHWSLLPALHEAQVHRPGGALEHRSLTGAIATQLRTH